MNVKELIAELQELPEDLIVVASSCSDYAEVEGAVVHDVVCKSWYFMRTHPTMSKEDKDRVTQCVEICF